MKKLIVFSLVCCLTLALPLLAADKKKDAKPQTAATPAAAQPQVDPQTAALQKIQEGYSNVLKGTGDAQAVATLIEEFLVTYPSFAQAVTLNVYAVNVYQKLGTFEKIEHHAKKAIEALPATDYQGPMLAVTLAGMYLDKGNLEGAEALYTKAQAQIPGLQSPANYPPAQWDNFINQMKWQISAGLGDVYYKMAVKFNRETQKTERRAMLDKCIASMNEAVKLNAKDDYTYLILGTAWALHGDGQEDKDFVESLNNLAKAVALAGQMADAAKVKIENILEAMKKAGKDQGLTYDKLIQDAKTQLGIS